MSGEHRSGEQLVGVPEKLPVDNCSIVRIIPCLDQLRRVSKDYQRRNRAILSKYWQVEVLDLISAWDAAKHMAESMKALNEHRIKSESKTPKLLPLFDEFSPDYERRKTAADAWNPEMERRLRTEEEQEEQMMAHALYKHIQLV